MTVLAQMKGPEIDWSAPDEELHRFHNERTRPLGVQLCGRRLYEVMTYWDTVEADASAPAYVAARRFRWLPHG